VAARIVVAAQMIRLNGDRHRPWAVSRRQASFSPRDECGAAALEVDEQGPISALQRRQAATSSALSALHTGQRMK
jgi:hypothetical protein